MTSRQTPDASAAALSTPDAADSAAWVPVPHAPRWGETFELRVEALDDRGRGLGPLHVAVGPQGLQRTYRVTVPTTVPGDLVTVRIGKPRRRKVDGRLVALLEPAPERVAPACAHFGPYDGQGRGCGGCALQSLPYPAQLAHKARRVTGLLASADVPPDKVAEVHAATSPWDYRNKMEFSFGDNPAREPTVGLHPAGKRHEVLDLTDCRLQSPETMALLAIARERLRARGLRHHDQRRDTGWLRSFTVREGKRTGERLVELLTNAHPTVDTVDGPRPAADEARDFAGAVWEGAQAQGLGLVSLWWSRHDAQRGRRTQVHSDVLHGRETLREELHVADDVRLRFDIHPRAFFQPNTLQAETLYRLVLAALGDAAASAHVLDLYCGTGTIALCVAHRVARVTGVELSPEAVANAEANAALNGVTNARFVCGDVGAVLEQEALCTPGAADAVIVDPPRAGLMPAAVTHLCTLRAPRLIYVSCNPASLARDLVPLQAAGYTLERAWPVDHFPQTGHVETVALLTLSET